MIRTGERISRNARIRLSCAAAVFRDGAVLLTKRRDNGRWCFPAGAIEPGESAAEACEREVLEETGLVVRAVNLIGVYSDPHRVFEYPDGNRWHVVELLFRAEIAGSSISETPEVIECRFFDEEKAAELDLMEHDRERLADVWNGATPLIR